MATIERCDDIEDIKARPAARELTRRMHAVTCDHRFSRDFGLKGQIRRASVSVMANIAEGFERDGAGEFLQCLSIAKGSAGEVCSHLYVAYDMGHIGENVFQELSSSPFTSAG